MENTYTGTGGAGATGAVQGGNGHGRGFVDRLKQQASTRVDEQKFRATERVSHFADALRQSSTQLRDHEFGAIADYLEEGISQVQRFADRMRDKPVAEIFEDLQRFGRRRPTALIAGSFIAGLAVARFLKAGGRHQYREYDEGPRRQPSAGESSLGQAGASTPGAAGTFWNEPAPGAGAATSPTLATGGTSPSLGATSGSLGTSGSVGATGGVGSGRTGSTATGTERAAGSGRSRKGTGGAGDLGTSGSTGGGGTDPTSGL